MEKIRKELGQYKREMKREIEKRGRVIEKKGRGLNKREEGMVSEDRRFGEKDGGKKWRTDRGEWIRKGRRYKRSEESGRERGVKGMEVKIKMWDKEEKKRNVIIKGMKPVKGDLKWGVEKIMKEIGAEVNVKELRIETGREEWGDMMVIGFGSEGKKREVKEKKEKLKGKRVWIDENSI